ncbi:hypothetical protein HU200_046781 [Digitaria exilis]|uniref:Uncharacterized protein n=1 Tax=Digitaria exilis TaxID=1010633 RepID=A0A835AYD2_9POAL|nr:hypothetical protein HU200_046781 [Digitaria exilis]
MRCGEIFSWNFDATVLMHFVFLAVGLQVWPPYLGVEAGPAKLPPPLDLCCSLQDSGATPPGYSMVYGNSLTSLIARERDFNFIVVITPRLLQSVFAAFGDLYVYKLSKSIFNVQVAQWTVSLKSYNMYIILFPS